MLPTFQPCRIAFNLLMESPSHPKSTQLSLSLWLSTTNNSKLHGSLPYSLIVVASSNPSWTEIINTSGVSHIPVFILRTAYIPQCIVDRHSSITCSDCVEDKRTVASAMIFPRQIIRWTEVEGQTAPPDWLIVPTRPSKSALNRTRSNSWIVRLTRFRDTWVGSDSLPHDAIYSFARYSGVFLRVNRTVWRGKLVPCRIDTARQTFIVSPIYRGLSIELPLINVQKQKYGILSCTVITGKFR